MNNTKKIYVGFNFLGLKIKYQAKTLSDAEIFMQKFQCVNSFIHFIEV